MKYCLRLKAVCLVAKISILPLLALRNLVNIFVKILIYQHGLLL